MEDCIARRYGCVHRQLPACSLSSELVKSSLIWGMFRAVLPFNSTDYRVILTLIDSAWLTTGTVFLQPCHFFQVSKPLESFSVISIVSASPLKKKKNHRKQRTKEGTDLVTWWMVLVNVCTEGWWDFKSCKQKSCVSPQASQDAIICTLFLLWWADQAILVFSRKFQTGLFPISVCSGLGPFCMPAHHTGQLGIRYWLCGRLNYFYHSSRWVVSPAPSWEVFQEQ